MTRKMISGGSWLDYPKGCRSACRGQYEPGDPDFDLGFRVVCNEPERSIPKNKVMSGGCWGSNLRDCQSAYRSSCYPHYGFFDSGFRVVCNE